MMLLNLVLIKDMTHICYLEMTLCCSAGGAAVARGKQRVKQVSVRMCAKGECANV